MLVASMEGLRDSLLGFLYLPRKKMLLRGRNIRKYEEKALQTMRFNLHVTLRG
jgi:hypothetical protein